MGLCAITMPHCAIFAVWKVGLSSRPQGIVVAQVNPLTDKCNIMDILNEIVEHKKVELEQYLRFLPESRLFALVEGMMADDAKAGRKIPSMRQSVMNGSGIIAEFKRKSPSKGWIHREASPDQVTPAYQAGGASALSILTDRDYFGGYDEFIQIARKSGVTLPILYKNFVIDPYQLLLARHCGASAVLLIAACLSKELCANLLKMAHQLGLEVLLEMHDEEDIEYAELGPDLYGINNRNLGTFITDVDNSFRLAEKLPKDVCKVSESGIGKPDTVKALRQAGFNGFLIGETFMKEPDPGLALKNFIRDLA